MRDVEAPLFPGEIDESFEVLITKPPTSGDIVACYMENKYDSEYYLNFKYYDRELKQKKLKLPADEYFQARVSDACSFKIRSINYHNFKTWLIKTEYEDEHGDILSFVDEITIVHKINVFQSDIIYIQRHETVVLDFKNFPKEDGDCYLQKLGATDEEEIKINYFYNDKKENFQLQQKRTCAFKIVDADDETFNDWMVTHTYDSFGYYSIARYAIAFQIKEKFNSIVNTY